MTRSVSGFDGLMLRQRCAICPLPCTQNSYDRLVPSVRPSCAGVYQHHASGTPSFRPAPIGLEPFATLDLAPHVAHTSQVLLMSILDLPFAISPVVTGLMLVLLYGRNGWFAPVLDAVGFNVVFAFPGALGLPPGNQALFPVSGLFYPSFLDLLQP